MGSETMGHDRAVRMQAVALAVVLVLAVVSIRAARSDPVVMGDLERFRSATQLDIGPSLPFFGAGLDGDGQAFAAIASDPLGRQEHFALFAPDYRYARSGFSWLGSMLVLGVDGLLLAGIAAVGLLSVGLVGYVAVRERERLGIKAWWLIANPALFIAVGGDTAESLAILLLVLALLGGHVWSAVSLAVVRPSYLLALLDRRRLFIPAIGMALGFRLFWVLRFDGVFSGFVGTLGLPFGGFIAEPSVAGLVVTAAAVVTIVIGVLNKSWSWVLSGLLVVCLTSSVHLEPLIVIRVAGMLPVLWAFGPQRHLGIATSKEEESGTSEPVLKLA